MQAAGLIRNATDDEALFVRDLVSDSKSFAQLRQDLWVLHETRHKRNGYFVEFGAADGVNLSNTCLLEREFGWRGILAEPNPAWHAALRQNRKADIDLRCVFGRSGERVAFAATKHPELATIVGYEFNDGHRLARQDRTVVEVETVSLNDLLTQHDAPHEVDYISIDTEGSELDILAPFDFKRWNVTLFSVEHNATASGAGVGPPDAAAWLRAPLSKHLQVRRLVSESGLNAYSVEAPRYFRSDS